MANNASVSGSPTAGRLAPRLNQLSFELVHAWDSSDSRLLKQWSLGTAQTFGTALTRRAKNLVGLVGAVGKGSWNEAGDAAAAYRDDRLPEHLGSRTRAAYDTGANYAASMRHVAAQTASLLRTRPREALPQFLALVATSVLVSGGPDGDGGAPDLDLMFGIGAHRSLFSHSVLMGAALETSFLSLVSLVRLVHTKLPEPHDALWDSLCGQADSIARAASAGASLGMSYHLLVDGLLQPAAYHGLGVPLPMEAHQAIFVANGAAEGIDARHKPSLDATAAQRETSPTPATPLLGRAPPTAIALAEHRRYLAQAFHVEPIVAEVLTAEELQTLRKYGCWFQALSTGELGPITPAQVRFVKAAQGKLPPETEHEHIWQCVRSLSRLGTSGAT